MKRDVSKEFLDQYYAKKDALESERAYLKKLLSLRLRQLNRLSGTRARLTDSRVKRPGKIWKKAVERRYSPSKAFKKIIDILGFRIVCNNLSDVHAVIEMLKKEGGVFEIVKIHDMVANPREDGYRGVHVHMMTRHFGLGSIESTPCEIQIRTLSQDTWGRLSREDLYGKNPPKTISELARVLSDQLDAIDRTAQLIRDELNKPAKTAQDIDDSDTISPPKLALLYKTKYHEDLYEWSLHDWVLNLNEAEVETIREVKNLLGNDDLRKKLDDAANHIRGYFIEDSEWVVFSAKVASEINQEAGIKAVTDDMEAEWDEISSIALREMLPASIEDFIEELEFSLTGSKDAMESSETIESYFSILECISVGMYGEKSLDEICAVEAILGYYEDDSYEERIGDLVSEWSARYM